MSAGVGVAFIAVTIRSMTLGITAATGVAFTTLGIMVPVGAGVGADLGTTAAGAGVAVGMAVAGTDIIITITEDITVLVTAIRDDLAHLTDQDVTAAAVIRDADHMVHMAIQAAAQADARVMEHLPVAGHHQAKSEAQDHPLVLVTELRQAEDHPAAM